MTAPSALAEARLPPIDRGDILRQGLSHQSLEVCLSLPLCFRILNVFIPEESEAEVKQNALRMLGFDADPARCERAYVGNTIGQAMPHCLLNLETCR